MPGLIDTAADLVDVSGNAADGGSQFLLLGVACLNSSFIKHHWRAKYSDNKALFPKIKGFQLKELPIPIVTLEQQKPVVDIVDEIISAKRLDHDADTSELEAKINLIIEAMYTQSA